MITAIRDWFEVHAFGVCTWLGGKLGIRTTRIRMYFIYLTFFTVGSPILIYFMLAFLLEHREYFRPLRTRRKTVWDI
ncbi:MAG: PspC family transcriptional regulator [Bacteroidia bacterium]|nr:PspC family transcriptional regulator [Bacteroidia bacterium]